MLYLPEHRGIDARKWVDKLLMSRSIIIGSIIAISMSAAAYAQSGTLSTQSGAAHDCGEASIDFESDDSLTKEEITAKMDEALFESLSKYDACQDETQSSESNNTASSDSNSSSGGGAGAQSSAASSDMSGTEESQSSQAGGAGSVASAQGAEAADQGLNEGAESEETGSTGGSLAGVDGNGAGGNGTKVLENGKLPDDIPPAENDSVLEAQIRRAAEAEQDPVVRKRLWNEYRKYKGIPTVD